LWKGRERKSYREGQKSLTGAPREEVSNSMLLEEGLDQLYYWFIYEGMRNG